jgi:hypothetical protein
LPFDLQHTAYIDLLPRNLWILGARLLRAFPIFLYIPQASSIFPIIFRGGFGRRLRRLGDSNLELVQMARNYSSRSTGWGRTNGAQTLNTHPTAIIDRKHPPLGKVVDCDEDAGQADPFYGVVAEMIHFLPYQKTSSSILDLPRKNRN